MRARGTKRGRRAPPSAVSARLAAGVTLEAHASGNIIACFGGNAVDKTDKVIIAPGLMKLFYVLEGTVALHYNGDVQRLEAGDSAYLDGGTPHGWENLGGRIAKALRVILG